MIQHQALLRNFPSPSYGAYGIGTTAHTLQFIRKGRQCNEIEDNIVNNDIEYDAYYNRANTDVYVGCHGVHNIVSTRGLPCKAVTPRKTSGLSFQKLSNLSSKVRVRVECFKLGVYCK